MQQRTFISAFFYTTGITLALSISYMSNGMDVLKSQIRECDSQVQELIKKHNIQIMQFREKPDQHGTFEMPVTSYEAKINKLLGQRKTLAAQLQEITDQSKNEKNRKCLIVLREALNQHTKHAAILEQVIDVLKKQDVTNKPQKAAQIEALLTEKTKDLIECNQNRATIERQIAALTQEDTN